MIALSEYQKDFLYKMAYLQAIESKRLIKTISWERYLLANLVIYSGQNKQTTGNITTLCTTKHKDIEKTNSCTTTLCQIHKRNRTLLFLCYKNLSMEC